MIYLDNAATSCPKPESVYQTMDDFLRTKGVIRVVVATVWLWWLGKWLKKPECLLPDSLMLGE